MIKWNWKPDLAEAAFIDIESQSAVDIRVGGRRYAAHPTTRIACACILVDADFHVWLPASRAPSGTRLDAATLLPRDATAFTVHTHYDETLPPAVAEALRSRTLIAHNALGFDAHVWDKCVGGEWTWADTLPWARAAGLPGKLDDLGHLFLGTGKSKIGGALIQLLCKARSWDGRIEYPLGTSHVWQLFTQYCALDVLLLRMLYPYLRPYSESRVVDVDRIINERGIPIDRAFCATLARLYAENAAKLGTRAAEATDGILDADAMRSTKQVQTWLRNRGVNVPSLDRKELKKFFDEPEAFVDGEDGDSLAVAVEVLRLRQSIVRTGTGKLKAVAEHCYPDSRMRGQLAYHSAHTGRWGGRELQPHNFPRGVDGLLLEPRHDLTLVDVEAEAERLGASVGDILGTLLRPIIRVPNGKCGIVDYGAVEARAVGWLADDQALLSAFGDPHRSVYCDLGARIYGHPIAKKADPLKYWVAKQAVLGCGYGMGWVKFVAYCEVHGVDLAAAGVAAKDVIDTYRATFARVPALWRLYQQAAVGAINGNRVSVGRCTFDKLDGAMRIRLPSGRHLVYRNARVEDRVPGYALMQGESFTVPTICYDGPRHAGTLYGGRIMENIGQAMCRDILADALVQLEAEGIPPIFHVHDEAVTQVETEAQFERQCVIMSTPPAWCPDFPLLVEGFTSPYYAKSPPKGTRVITAFKGAIL